MTRSGATSRHLPSLPWDRQYILESLRSCQKGKSTAALFPTSPQHLAAFAHALAQLRHALALERPDINNTLFALCQIRQHQGKETLAFQVERKATITFNLAHPLGSALPCGTILASMG